MNGWEWDIPLMVSLLVLDCQEVLVGLVKRPIGCPLQVHHQRVYHTTGLDRAFANGLVAAVAVHLLPK